MDATPNFAIPIPKEGNSVADEFYRLMVAMGVIDEVLKAILDNANGRAPLEHTQAMSTIIGLVEELAGKMPAGRVFKLDDLIDVEGADGAPAGYTVVKNGAGMWVPSSALAALGPHGHLMSEITGLPAALSARPERAEVEEALDLLGGETADDLAAAVAALTAEINKRGVPLGTMVHSAVPLESQGYLRCNGQPCTPVYPDLRTALIAAGSPFGNNGVDPLVPDEETANRFRRAAGGSLALGTVQNDAIRNITGSIDFGTNNFSPVMATGTLTGPFKKGTARTNSTGGGALASHNLDFDASLVVPTADENRPKAIAYLPYIKAFGAITIEGMADLSALFAAVATKSDAEAGADNTKLMTALRTREAIAAQVAGLIAAMPMGSVGTYALVRETSTSTGTLTEGTIVAGSTLVNGGFYTTGATGSGLISSAVASGPSLSGSWMILGTIGHASASLYRWSLAKRVS